MLRLQTDAVGDRSLCSPPTHSSALLPVLSQLMRKVVGGGRIVARELVFWASAGAGAGEAPPAPMKLSMRNQNLPALTWFQIHSHFLIKICNKCKSSFVLFDAEHIKVWMVLEKELWLLWTQGYLKSIMFKQRRPSEHWLNQKRHPKNSEIGKFWVCPVFTSKPI